MAFQYCKQLRKSERFPCKLTGTCSSETHLGLTCNFEDISLRGARILLTHPLGIDTAITLVPQQGFDDELLLKATVRWCKRALQGFRAGVQFSKRLPFSPETID